MLLREIKVAIGNKELSIAVPGLERDMIAFTAKQVPLINAAVDVVNVSIFRYRGPVTFTILNSGTDHACCTGHDI